MDFTLENIGEAARAVLDQSSELNILLFEGEMGVGKTTLIKSVCHQLDIQDRVSSPTFSIVNEYLGEDGKSIYHFDLYRVENERELLDIGFEDYLDSGSICLIEWPKIAANFLTYSHLVVSLELNGSKRSIRLTRKL